MMNENLLEGHSGVTREILQSAFRAAFGSIPVDIIARLTGGATTALTLQVKAGNRHYLVWVEGDPSPLRNPFQRLRSRAKSDRIWRTGRSTPCIELGSNKVGFIGSIQMDNGNAFPTRTNASADMTAPMDATSQFYTLLTNT